MCIENSNTTDSIKKTKDLKENVEMEINGQLRIVFDEDINDKDKVIEEPIEEENNDNENEVDKDPNQDELYKFDPDKEKYWNR